MLIILMHNLREKRKSKGYRLYSLENLRMTKSVKLIFVSCGNWIDLDTSTEMVMNCINKESRLPIPVRLADLETHKVRKQRTQ